MEKQRVYFRTGATLDVSFRVRALNRLADCIRSREADKARKPPAPWAGSPRWRGHGARCTRRPGTRLARYAAREGNPLYPVPVLMDAGELARLYEGLLEESV